MPIEQPLNGPGNRLIGIISDTHGLVRPEALEALAGCDLILHGGDIGKPDVLDALEAIAPVIAIRGNVDREAWADPIPLTRTLDLAGNRIHLLHNIADLPKNAAKDFDVIVFGHSHKARCEQVGATLYFNPGSAGPRRFKLPVTLGRLRLIEGELVPEIIDLPV